MVNVFLAMINLPDGSENLFFNYFEPRVLPKEPLQPFFEKLTIEKDIRIYFGENDWADRTGCQNLAKKNKKIKISILEQCQHNIPFHINSLRTLIKEEMDEKEDS